MTHLPYVLSCYGLAVLVAGGLGISSALRLGAARRRLAAVDPRAAGRGLGRMVGGTP